MIVSLTALRALLRKITRQTIISSSDRSRSHSRKTPRTRGSTYWPGGTGVFRRNMVHVGVGSLAESEMELHTMNYRITMTQEVHVSIGKASSDLDG